MLSEAQQAEFWENGVIVLESVYSERELEPLRRQHQRWIDESREYDGSFCEMLEIPKGASFFDQQAGTG